MAIPSVDTSTAQVELAECISLLESQGQRVSDAVAMLLRDATHGKLSSALDDILRRIQGDQAATVALEILVSLQRASLFPFPFGHSLLRHMISYVCVTW